MHDAQEVAHYLVRHGVVLATAESCTAGLIASKLAEVPGCGSCLRLAVVTYAPEAKKNVLGVEHALIERHGLTSEPVSLAMARGVLEMSGADLAVSNTGVADEGAPDGTPAGTQCFAWIVRAAGRSGTPIEYTETKRFQGERNEIRDAAAAYALGRIPHYLALARGTPE
ncbi:CinA family protein [Cupriavidus plantarum]|uniref:CinA family protein n=1 Tax=Cupriavidus plantarum TaxID=942865 RepID=UPI000E245311|nr:CinA family protein [Cupriavidus plantarum]NYI02622.1 PncC family amidohydrolase [Cupriavidus plantarum]REE87562.1 PncC family amidohydrolase [Cupriavidus plantarum]RLK29995.1 PncC family amidohydrolase [Cupriavidus plantarum]